MKSKKRHHTSSEESQETEGSARSSSSSDSDSDDSSITEHRHKKKRKRAHSSESESDTDDQKRAKRRKHKKKKKKHGKKKRRSESAAPSVSVEEISISEGEISPKKKRKHKHKHDRRDRSTSVSDSEEEKHVERRLHSVVKERRASSEERPRHADDGRRTYYQREYRQSQSGGEPVYEREQEVQRFYKGSSKERSLQQYNEHYQYERQRHDKYAEKFHNPKYGHTSVPFNANEEFDRRQRESDYRRHQRYDDRRPQQEEYHSRTREEHYQPRENTRGFNQYNRYNQYEGEFKRRENEDVRDYRERRPPPQPGHFKEREYPDKRYVEPLAPERPREVRRERPPPRRPEKPVIPHRDPSRSRSTGDRYREQISRRPEHREEREERFRDGRGDHREEVIPSHEHRPREDKKEVRDDQERRESRPDRKDSREDRREVREDRREVREDRRDVRDDRRDTREVRRESRDDRRERPVRSAERKPERPPIQSDSKPRERKSRFGANDNKEYSWGKTEVKKEGTAPEDKEKPNFGLSGKLTEDANTVNGVVIKYTQPDDAKQPKRRWRFYPFKGDKALPILYIHRQSAFLIGRDKKVVDIILEHPSISKQHAALQYRATPFTRPDGSQGRRVRPYIIDLESANGTFVNNKKIDPRCYVELLERDVVKFGFSQREYVLLHENSKDDGQDDDQEPAAALPVTTDHIKSEKRAQQERDHDGE